MKRFENMKDMYIHYGHEKFEQTKFKPIRNLVRNKPDGGLWASRVNAEFGWKDWCDQESFRECTNNNSFKFTITDNANIIHIRAEKDIEQLPKEQ